MRSGCLFLIVISLVGCKPGRKVNTSFYYWKTVYKQNDTTSAYLNQLHVHKLYIRMMDVDIDEDGLSPIPVSPVSFQNKLEDTIEIVPVVFIVNDVLRNQSLNQLNQLSRKLYHYIDGKVLQSGKRKYDELQIDCDWTVQTRDNYFYLLKQIKALAGNKQLSVTLRLHQLKNQKTSGIPPADKVLLMCYNMGNLRKYGNQNSIIELSELKKYAGNNLNNYPMAMDIGLPLFNWAVAFRDQHYIGIDKRINFDILNHQNQFILTGVNLYTAKTDLPAYGLKKGDEVRWEDSGLKSIQAAAAYLSAHLRTEQLNVIYFHLDEVMLKNYSYEGVQQTTDLFR